MLPTSSLKSLFYPMTAEIYYSENKQDALGVVQKSWVYDRTVKCSVISTMSDRTLTSEIKNNSSNFSYNSDLLFRVGENVQEKKNGTIYPITEILITNVKDPSGLLVFKEKGNIPTQYELKTFVTSYDGDHLIAFWRGYMSRSTKQNEVIY
jgi:hypothetical protein